MRNINIFLVLSVCVCIGNSQLQLRLNENKDSSILFDLAHQLFLNYFGSVRKIAFRYPEQCVEITKIIQKIRIPITINAEEIPLKQGLDLREPSEVIFFWGESTNVSTHLNNSLWTTNTHFVLAFQQSNNTEKTLTQLFEIFKFVNVVNVIALVATSDGVLIYSYTSFNFQECDSVKLHLLGTQIDEVFIGNRLNNYNGCFLNVSVVNLPPMVIFPKSKNNKGLLSFEGTEVNIIREISKKMNFTPRFAVAKDGEAWGWIHPIPRGVVGEVYLKQSYFGIGLLASTLERYESLDMTVPISPSRECITSVVPTGAAKSQATWIGIYVTEFSWLLWCCILFFFCLGSFTFWSISKTLETSSFCSITLHMFSSFISVSVKPPQNTPLRSLFLGWIWYSFIVVVSYQSLMGSKLTVSYRVREIDTISDLLESNLHITGLYNTIRLLNYEAEGDIKKVVERIYPTNYGITKALQHIVFDRNISYLRETTSLKYYSMLNPQLRGKVHLMKECLYEYYPIMVLQRRSPLTKVTNHIIIQLFESGILLKWRQQYLSEVYKKRPSSIRLTLQHMAAPFVALMFGLALATLSFITEKFYYNISKGAK